MVIKNGLVFDENKGFVKRDVFTANGIITETAEDSAEVIDVSDCYVIPGLVDVHTHGAVGHDFCDADPEGLKATAKFEKSRGVTSFCPTSMTYDEGRLSKIFTNPALMEQSPDMARFIGINMEGPYICKEKKGAQNADYIQPADADMFRRLNSLSGNRIKLVTLAPETEGALDFVDKVHDEVHISLGHTSTDYNTAKQAFDRGADHVTHLFNAMPPFLHRAPGLIGAAADDEKVFVEMICDGLHLDPAVIRSAIKLFGPDRAVAISDSMEACGMPDGEYELGGQKVFKTGNKATLSDGTLAGSATDLMGCFRTLLSVGVDLVTAVRMASTNPARSIGETRVGTLRPGAFSDIVILDRNYDIVRVI